MVWVTKTAFREIERECHKKNRETGGILVGPAGSDFMTGFIPSGQAAHRSFAGYEQTPEDVDHLNRELRKRQARGEEFKGYLHKHPGQMKQLSSVDLETGREVLHSPSYDLGGRLWMAVVTDRSGSWRRAGRRHALHFYKIEEPTAGRLTCQAAEYEQIDDDDPRIQKEISRALEGRRWMEQVDKGGFSRGNLGFLWTEYGQKVLARELQELREAGHEAELRIVDNAACVEIQLPGNRAIAAFLAGEYPMAPPRLFLLQADGTQAEIVLGKLFRWSSLFSIKELVDDLKSRKPETWKEGGQEDDRKSLVAG